MGSGSKHKGGVDMGSYISSVKEQTAYMWCVRNNIFISPKAISTTEWKIAIVIQGKENISPESYKKVDVWKQLYLFYLYYYNKYNTNIKIEPMLVTKKETKVKQKSNDNQLF